MVLRSDSEPTKDHKQLHRPDGLPSDSAGPLVAASSHSDGSSRALSVMESLTAADWTERSLAVISTQKAQVNKVLVKLDSQLKHINHQMEALTVVKRKTDSDSVGYLADVNYQKLKMQPLKLQHEVVVSREAIAHKYLINLENKEKDIKHLSIKMEEKRKDREERAKENRKNRNLKLFEHELKKKRDYLKYALYLYFILIASVFGLACKKH